MQNNIIYVYFKNENPLIFTNSRKKKLTDYKRVEGGHQRKMRPSTLLIFLLGISLSLHGVNSQISNNPCQNTLCQNGATCNVLSSTTFECRCRPGFLGTYCETFSNSCDQDPCGVGGLCNFRNDGTAFCYCLAGYTGPYCQTSNLIVLYLYHKSIISKTLLLYLIRNNWL